MSLNALDEKIVLIKKEAEIKFIRSTGPGGQNVNKTNSAAQLRWSLLNTLALNEHERKLCHLKLSSQLTTEGELIIKSTESRNQAQNINAIPVSIDQLSKLKGNDYPMLIDGFAVTAEIEKIERLHIKQRDLKRKEYKSDIDCLEKKIEDEAKFYQSKISYLGRYLNEANKSLNESNDKIEKLDI
jgi:hypothetical protein